MPEPLALGSQVVLVVRVRDRLDRELVRHGQPVPLEAMNLLRVVGEDADAGQAQVDQDLGTDAVVAQVGGQAELQVRVDGVEPLLLEAVGAQLVQEPDPAALLRQVQQHPRPLALDHRERRLELLAAVAAQRVEDVAGEALGVDADQDVVHVPHLSLDHREVVLVVDERPVADGRELAERGRELRGDHALDQPLGPPPVGDEVGDGDHRQAVLLAVRHQVRNAGHRAVLVHDLADHAGRDQARESGQVDRGLGLASTLQDAAVLRLQREDVPRLDEVIGAGVGIDRDLDRASAVGRRDPRGHAVAGLDRDRERGVERGLVLRRHQVEPELVAPLARQRQADQAAAVLGHEVDRLRGRELGGHREVALVLAVLVVADDDHPAPADLLDRLLNRTEGCG